MGRGRACLLSDSYADSFASAKKDKHLAFTPQIAQVEDMEAVDAIVAAPFHEITHPDYGTKMRMLDSEVPFKISIAAT